MPAVIARPRLPVFADRDTTALIYNNGLAFRGAMLRIPQAVEKPQGVDLRGAALPGQKRRARKVGEVLVSLERVCLGPCARH